MTTAHGIITYNKGKYMPKFEVLRKEDLQNHTNIFLRYLQRFQSMPFIEAITLKYCQGIFFDLIVCYPCVHVSSLVRI
jgi:hypothetical protein